MEHVWKHNWSSTKTPLLFPVTPKVSHHPLPLINVLPASTPVSLFLNQSPTHSYNVQRPLRALCACCTRCRRNLSARVSATIEQSFPSRSWESWGQMIDGSLCKRGRWEARHIPELTFDLAFFVEADCLARFGAEKDHGMAIGFVYSRFFCFALSFGARVQPINVPFPLNRHIISLSASSQFGLSLYF